MSQRSGSRSISTVDAAADPESDEWISSLAAPHPEQAQERLHALLLRVARAEVYRRAPQLRVSGPELDDLAHQAAADALLAVVAKRDQFRGESRFTTWAYRFVILEVSTKIGRHFWQNPSVPLESEDWERLPDRLGFDPVSESETREIVAVVRKAVDEELTGHQRRVFHALVLDGIPLDALALELGSNRNAIYKTLFDARRKLRAALVANGHLDFSSSRRQ